MILTKKQEEGLRIALERYNHGEKFTVISGYAGAGKTTLVRFIIDALGVDENSVRYVAFTGKAANVLKQKNCPNPTTAHKLLYHAKRMPSGKYLFTPKTPRELAEENIEVVVVDEVSMLPWKIWHLLCQHNFYILACGDPEQLPPVPDEPGEDPDNHVLDNPHIFLDEIMRQAQESEIIRLSMHVREGKPINTFQAANEQVMIFPKSEVSLSMLTWADQVLCATNRNKNNLNYQMRFAYNLPELPQVGDKIINLHNEWEILSNQGNPLTNGIIGTIKQMVVSHWTYPTWLRNTKLVVPVLTATISGDSEDEEYNMITFDYNELLTGEASLSLNEEYRLEKLKKYALPLHGNYGYAITTWKAQGSEWNKVLLFEEAGWPRGFQERKKFLYTGITRAVDKLVVIKKDDF